MKFLLAWILAFSTPLAAQQPVRAVIVFSQRPVAPAKQAVYYVSIDATRYTAIGEGPKTAGLYDVDVSGEEITVHEYHAGKPAAVHSLNIKKREVNQPTQVAEAALVSFSRLLVYSADGNHSQAVTLDAATQRGTYYALVGKVPLGLFDFAVKGATLTVYMYHITKHTDWLDFNIQDVHTD